MGSPSNSSRSRPPEGFVEAPIDKLSNRALDAIKAHDYKKAEKLCRRLLREYPDQFDGHARLGMLREAQGRFEEAAEQYSKLLEMIKRSPGGTDKQTVRYFERQRDQALDKAKM